MTKKQKITLCACALCLISAIVLAIVTIWALDQQNFRAGFNAVYLTSGYGTASVNYKLGDDGVWTALKDSSSKTDAVLNSNALSVSFSSSRLSLTSQNNYVVIEHAFTNANSTEYTAYVNMAPDYNCIYTSLITSHLISDNFAEQINEPFRGFIATTVPANGVQYVYILATLNGTSSVSPLLTSNLVLDRTEDFSSYLNFNSSTGTVTGLKDKTLPVLRIPEKIDNVTVTQIGENAIKENSTLEIVILPNTIISIDAYAFYLSSGLKSVNFSADSKLESIGRYAFYECRGLTSITIPSKVSNIGDYAFYHCTELTAITIDSPDIYTKLTSTTACGSMLSYIGSGDKVYVLTSVVNSNTNTYINSTSWYSSKTISGDYTVFTKK